MDKTQLQIREGQTIRVYQKIVEGKRERNVPFPGRVMRVRGIGINKMVTVKQTLEGVEVERIYPIASPTITKIEIVEEKESKKSAVKRRKIASRK